MSGSFPRSARELEVWNGAIVQAAAAVMRAAAAVRAKPLAEGQTLGAQRAPEAATPAPRSKGGAAKARLEATRVP